MAARPVLLALALSAVDLGCGEPPPRPVPTVQRVDKRVLYGDPLLVPTREGERARRELALAAQVERALADVPGVGEATVDVEIAAPDPPRTVAVVRARHPEVDVDRLHTQVEEIAAGIVGEGPRVVQVHAPEPEPEPVAGDGLSLSLALMLGVLGLGVSLGMAGERLRVRRRLARRRRRRAAT